MKPIQYRKPVKKLTKSEKAILDAKILEKEKQVADKKIIKK